MNEPTVAVIATVLNEREGIQGLLDAFLAQQRPADEIVVVDGGSTDGTLDVLHAYQQRHPAVKVYVDPGVNIARGRNLAILRTNADIIAVTDGGCRPEPRWLGHLIRPLIADPGLGAVAGHTRIAATSRFEEFAGLLATSVNASDEAVRVFHGRNSAFRRVLWRDVGGYPEWLYTAEDTLFCQRAKSLGYRVGMADDAVVAWRPRPTLRQLAKQYYLYGRGTGRIGRSDPRSIRYHLRNHAVLGLSLLVALVWPWASIAALGMLVFMYRLLVVPAKAALRGRSPAAGEAFYVPGIVLTRSLFNNLGQLRGVREYERTPPFREHCRSYMEGRWRMAELGPPCPTQARVSSAA